MNQATALQSLFSRLAARAIGWDELEPFEAYMRMALRAQAQCRATLETLAAIKNPPVVFAQAGERRRHGPQQINNGMATQPRAREKTKIRRTNYQGMAMSYYRTAEHRALRAALIRRWMPWKHSTGPKTPGGKARSAMRGYKGGTRDKLRELARLMRYRGWPRSIRGV